MEDQWHDHDAAVDQPGDDLVGERPSGARHLGASRHGGEHRLVGGDGPFAGGVRVADGRPMAVEVLEEGPGISSAAVHSRVGYAQTG